MAEQRKAKVKICGLYREEDIHMVNDFLPDYVGFVLHVPQSHRNVSIAQVKSWQGILSPQIKKVGVFVEEEQDFLAEVAPVLDVLQLHGKETETEVAEIRNRFPEKEIWKAVAVRSVEDVEAAFRFPADKILLDYGKGEGKAFDWSILHQVQKPFLLAGGITPENVGEALACCQPEVIDVSSGVEVNKVKDREKIRRLLENME